MVLAVRTKDRTSFISQAEYQTDYGQHAVAVDERRVHLNADYFGFQWAVPIATLRGGVCRTAVAG
eukprot:8655653-Lingulodinium_polyedra.AAC.1